MLHALGNILPSQMMDRELWDFRSLEQGRAAAGSLMGETDIKRSSVLKREGTG
jgi:hypothetical protein